MNPQEKLHEDIRKFLEVYKVLSPGEKAQFEAQLAGEIKNLDTSTKKLYGALLHIAKEDKGIEEAINEMQKIG